MFWEIFWFELKLRFRSKALWICWAIVMVKGITDVLSAYWELMMPSCVPLNSPFSIYYLVMFGGFWAQIFAVGFMAVPVLRDVATGGAARFQQAGFESRVFFGQIPGFARRRSLCCRS